MNPSTGTFISMDSYQGNIYDPVSLHKYLYANANPVKYSDPSGYSADDMVALEGETIIAASYAWQESVAFRIGMQALIQIRALQVVKAITYVSTIVILDIVINDALYQRYHTNAYDIVIEILEYVSDNLDTICNDAGVAFETIANQIKIAIHEARDGKKGGKGGKKGGKNNPNGKDGKSGQGSIENGESGKGEFKTKIPPKGGKKKDDIPDRFRGEKPYKGESGKDAARRVLKKYGEYDPDNVGPRSYFNQLKKYFDTHFE